MKINIGRADSVCRVLLGLGGFVAGYVSGNAIWYLIGTLVAVSGLMGYCPVYSALDWKSDNPDSDGTRPSAQSPKPKEAKSYDDGARTLPPEQRAQ